ncbi:MAG TPA: hypothetical protein VLM40_22730, partial [Gemmata sp.]|nr:hypothetical protein [Gemmata sp.]
MFLVFGVLILAFFAIAIVFIRHNRYAAEEEYQEGLLRQERPKPTAKNGRGTFTIGESTTYISGPLDENGHIDYP